MCGNRERGTETGFTPVPWSARPRGPVTRRLGEDEGCVALGQSALHRGPVRVALARIADRAPVERRQRPEPRRERSPAPASTEGGELEIDLCRHVRPVCARRDTPPIHHPAVGAVLSVASVRRMPEATVAATHRLMHARRRMRQPSRASPAADPMRRAYSAMQWPFEPCGVAPGFRKRRRTRRDRGGSGPASRGRGW